MNLYAPLGTLYAAAYAMHFGYSSALFDTMLVDSETDLLNSIKIHKPSAVVIYDDNFNYLTKMCLSRMRQAAFNMIQIAKNNNCKVIVSGSDAADHLEKYFLHKADFVICGEGEQTLIELLDFIYGKTNNSLENINGIAYLKDSKIFKTEPRKVIKNLDSLPFPAWELVDFSQYKKLWLKHHGYFSMNLVTTRGCPFHCNWCAKPIYGQVYNSHSPQYIVNQMKFLQEKYSPDHIWFCDDIFGLKPGWIAEFNNELKKSNINIPFKCLSRADLLLKEDNIRRLSEAGCKSVWIGAESGSQKILDAMEKGTAIEEIYSAANLLKKHNIEVCFFLQFGYTGETISEINQTIKMVNQLMPDDIGISVSYPLPGTKFYDRVVSEMKLKHNWELSDDFEMMFNGSYSTDFYRALHKRMHKEFRTRQILKYPIKKFKHLWKLPAYLFGWIWYYFKMYYLINSKSKLQLNNN